MNEMIKIAGLAVIGIASVHSAQAQMVATDSSKPWSVSAALRGFYDDNYATAPNSAVAGVNRKQESFGYEITPGANLNLQLEQTTISLGYVYSYRYYENRPENKADQSHSFNAKLEHTFNSRLKLNVSDSFVSAQEPLLIAEPNGFTPSPIRSNGDNIRNTGKIGLNVGVTEELEFVPTYTNTIYDYSDKDLNPGDLSRKALLNRMEQSFSLDARYLIQPKTFGVLGYAYGITEYDNSDNINPNFPTVAGSLLIPSDSRDQTNHKVYVGVDHDFSSQFSASVRVGARFTEYSNAMPGADDNKTSPYVDASMTYTYAPGSLIQAGIKVDHAASDVGAIDGKNPVTDTESVLFYVQVTHKLTEKLTLTALGQYQHAKYQGSTLDGLGDDFYNASVSLDYQFTKWLSAEAGYTYDKLDSELETFSNPQPRSYDRNRVYIGVRATY